MLSGIKTHRKHPSQEYSFKIRKLNEPAIKFKLNFKKLVGQF